MRPDPAIRDHGGFDVVDVVRHGEIGEGEQQGHERDGADRETEQPHPLHRQPSWQRARHERRQQQDTEKDRKPREGLEEIGGGHAAPPRALEILRAEAASTIA